MNIIGDLARDRIFVRSADEILLVLLGSYRAIRLANLPTM